MKTYKEIISEVAEPKGEDEKRFKAKHKFKKLIILRQKKVSLLAAKLLKKISRNSLDTKMAKTKKYTKRQ